jgi:SNF2 family DNA or RNA helicase
MDGRQAKAYEEMDRLSITELESGSLEALSALAELTRLKQLASCYGDIVQKPTWLTDENGNRYKGIKDFYVPKLPSNKFNWIIENLEEWGYPKNPLTKIVIVSFYTGILEVFREGIEKHFKTKPTSPLCAAITGNTPSTHRRRIIDRFNESANEQIMLLNVKAGGTAITIDSADKMIFVSETRIPDQQKQAEDRIHRVSNPRPCMYYYLRSLGTVDVGTALVNQEMIRDTHRLLDQRRGVDYMRHVMDLSHGN